jgi:arabinofuranan 3-O-arabinosyltransferase
VAAAAAALALALVGGPVAIAVPAVILLGWWRRQWVPWLAFTAMCVAGAFVIAGRGHGVQSGFGPFGWPAQAAALIAVAAALAPAVPRPRRKPPAGGLAAAEDDT